MKIKGDLIVSREISSIRSNEGLSVETLTADRLIDRYDSAWMTFDTGASDFDVELPDATTLPLGWKIVIHNTDAAGDLTVRSFDGTFTGTILKAIAAPALPNDSGAYQFTLYGNATAAGEWYVDELGDITNLLAARYVANFLVADWPAAVSGKRELTKTQVAGLGVTVHGRGATPVYVIQEKIGTDHDRVILDRERIASNGDVLLRIINNDEFDGRIVLV